MSTRKIIVYIATSADGFIARSDGSVDWLDRPRPAHHYGMGDFMKSVDTILFGRKTWEQSLKFMKGKKKKTPSQALNPTIRNYVFSSNAGLQSDEDFEFVHEPIQEFVQKLRAKPGKDIWMMGGGGIIGSFLDAGEIDEFIIHVIPVFIGDGIPLIAPAKRTVRLNLLDSHAYEDGVVRMHYSCKD